jgi:nanoRNase/pAp phosphatase (c-di-AMP/oligoRNAs hydrolase)
MDQIQQIIAKISGVQSILIIAQNTNGDSLASALALRAFLKKLEKDAVLLAPGAVPEKYAFLPEASTVLERIDLMKSFVIDVSTKRSEVAELSYKKEGDKLSIYLKPRTGEFAASDISFRSSAFPYELLILVGIPSLDQLGNFYSQQAELFFDVPIINIDFRGSNENYGQYNLVQLSATSCSEIILDLVNNFEFSLVDENIATQLLAGIISETNSFQHVRTTPQTFLKASQLVSLGAKQQEIISHLYKTKSLGLLKLWGRVLARLKQELDLALVHSAVTAVDVGKSTASPDDIEMIIKEMVANLGFAKIFMFLYEVAENKTEVYMHTSLPINLLSIYSQYKPQIVSPQTIKFVITQSVANSEKQLIDILRGEIQRLKLTL